MKKDTYNNFVVLVKQNLVTPIPVYYGHLYLLAQITSAHMPMNSNEYQKIMQN